MPPTTIDTSLIQLRNNLSSFIERAYHTNTQFRLTRHNKPIARIIGENFMQNLEQLLEQDPRLQETLAIMSDENMMDMLTQSRDDLQRGNVHSLANLLKE